VKEKVTKAVRELGLDVHVRTFESPTRTTREAAEAVGCEEGQIAKSLVFIADGEPILVVASGRHRVDLALVCEAVDCADARAATPEEVRSATGFSVGGVPPCGHDLPVIFDVALLEYETVWAAGGDGNTVFEVDPRVLAERTGAQTAPVGESG
jgi:prolyl-tRNA editing enzyme YbaK/EbsC (Cys-tRNA(Pro) deacylase)